MFVLGLLFFLIGFLVMLVGLGSGIAVPSEVLGSRVVNLGLIAQQSALVTAGAGFLITGSVFLAGRSVARQVRLLRMTIPRSGPELYANTQSGFQALAARTEPHIGPAVAVADERERARECALEQHGVEVTEEQADRLVSARRAGNLDEEIARMRRDGLMPYPRTTPTRRRV